jgi:hypothetical protein
MDPLPRARKRWQILLNHGSDTDQIASGKPIVLPQGNKTSRFVQVEDRFVTISNYMDMGRTVIIWVNRNPQCANPQNGWHELILS